MKNNNKIRKIQFYIFIFTLTLSFQAYITHAQETAANHGAGAIVIGYDTTCNASEAGAIRYNSSGPSIEVCDGTSWVAP